MKISEMYTMFLRHQKIVFVLLTISTLALAQHQDTVFAGNVYYVSFHNKHDKLICKATYDTTTHRLTQQEDYRGIRRTKVKQYHSDSSYSIGKKRGFYAKWGKWKTYDKNGQLLKIEKFRYNRHHGIQRNLVTHERQRYRYGIQSNELRNAKGQKYVFWFTAGMPMFRDFNCEEERYACQIFAIAGCLIPRGTFRTMALHNGLVHFRQSLRFGFGWKEKYWQGAGCSGGQFW